MPTEFELKALAAYCEWLNRVNRHNDGPEAWEYKPEQFTSGFGYTTTVAILNDFTHYPLHMIRVHDGDEGGAHMILVWEADGTPWHMVQEFDTMVGQVMYEGKLINTGGF
jgi:hypothetical protein